MGSLELSRPVQSLLNIAAPHIGDAVAKPIAAGLSHYEQLRGQVREGHTKALGALGEVQQQALPQKKRLLTTNWSRALRDPRAAAGALRHPRALG